MPQVLQKLKLLKSLRYDEKEKKNDNLFGFSFTSNSSIINLDVIIYFEHIRLNISESVV